MEESWKIYAQKLIPIEALDKYDLKDDFTAFVEKNARMEAKKDEKFTMHVNSLKAARSAIFEKNPTTYFDSIKDVYLPILDKEVLVLKTLTNGTVR